MTATLELIQLEAPGHDVEDAILAPLIAYNEQVVGPTNYAPLALVLREPGSDAILGGLWAECYYDWCFVRLLAVPEQARGNGLGTQLMARAEAFARQRGDAGIWLDTFSFQARGFYEKLGFTCFGELEGHPRGGRRFFMQKRL